MKAVLRTAGVAGSMVSLDALEPGTYPNLCHGKQPSPPKGDQII
jgi:hypothetical protein